MNMSDKIKSILTDAYLKLKIDFIAVYYNGKIIEYKGNINSGQFLVDLVTFVEKTLDISEVIYGFEEEYLVAENKNITIFLYYVSKDFVIIFINFSKSHLPTFKIEAENISQKILTLKDELDRHETITQSETQIEAESFFIQEEKIPSLEEILSEEESSAKESDISKEKEETLPAKEKKIYLNDKIKKIYLNDKIRNNIKKVKEINPMGILKKGLSKYSNKLTKSQKEETSPAKEEEEIYLNDTIIENIKKAFTKEIGPIGNIIFKKELSKYDNKLTKNQLAKFIDEIAEEIPNIERRKKFLEEIKHILED